MAHVAVIGAGPAGLAAAWDLVRGGHTVVLFEAGGEVGGLASGFRAAHWEWSLEKYYHHWFASDRHVLRLIHELGWSDDVRFVRPYTVVYHEGAFHPLDSYLEALRFSLRHFSASDIFRFGVVGTYLRFSPLWQPLEHVTADEWMRRWAGERIHRAIWLPLLAGKFGEENLPAVNMAWLWARIHSRTTRLGTFVGGFQAFFDRFAGRLLGLGVQLRQNCPVERMAATTPTGIEVSTTLGAERFDAAIFTGSPSALAALVDGLPEAYAELLTGLRALGAVVLVVALRHRLTRAYWHNLPKREGFPFLALVEHTNFASPEHFGGDHLVYCGDYLPPEHEYFSLNEEQLLERFLPTFTRLNPAFDRSWVRHTWLWRTPYAQPIPGLNHSRRIPPLATPIAGLYLASMSQVYPWDRGTNFAIELGRKAAALAATDLTG